ncbi:MAG: hypothetical protein LAQ69_49980, partial [Acidobacteriia bacterium]|nr:hypothetical protein [Terriglobia bacterium]
TPEGKLRSSRNAISHGLLADCVVLPGESREGFLALHNQHLERFCPVDDVEAGMVEEMAAASWRMRRAWAIENVLLEDALPSAPQVDDMGRIAASFRKLASSPELALLYRYEVRLHLMYHRALQNFLLLRTAGGPDQPDPVGQPEPPVTEAPEPVTPTSPCPSPGNPPDIPIEPSPISEQPAPVGQPERDSPLPLPVTGVPDLPTPPSGPSLANSHGIPNETGMTGSASPILATRLVPTISGRLRDKRWPGCGRS